ncbi:hypothetical protein [Empedobacter sp.]|uniref:NACHT domain-containing protein n=1 Tax=Empedobacter sp. TaxID=1927715 RepID=UPI002899FEB7|nr:hypothetical protein [Empedobacter sp.]
MNSDYLETRNIRFKRDINSDVLFYFEEENKLTLIELLKKERFIFLLGNPGFGKTTELNILNTQLEQLKNETNNYPILIDLKNFRKNNTLTDFISFKNWEKLSKVTFIFDGLDEIAHIQDFVSELEIFISKFSENNINIVISCRTNIYEKYSINLSEFSYVFLDGLTDNQINRILKNKTNKELMYSELNKYRVHLENPFNLYLFCDYYNINNKFPDNQVELWNLFIDKELDKLSKTKLIKREIIDIPHIKNNLAKVSFTNELMQQNYIDEENLYNLLGEKDKLIFEEISLIEKIPLLSNFTFRHKNYQEYFSAKLLEKLDVLEIIKIIQISPEINKTSPSLFNTISFLLNIIEVQKFEKITKWLLENEPELLFLAEKDRLTEELRKEIFKSYFYNTSIEKTFWLGKNTQFSFERIVEFADIEYLISIIEEDSHFRSVISAIDVLGSTNYNGHDDKILELFTTNIFNNKYVESCLRGFKNKKFHMENEGSFLKITKYFENDFSQEINHLIISMIADFKNVDDKFNIFLNSMYKLYEIRPERIKDRTIRMTDYIIQKIVFKIKDSDNYMKFLNILFSDKYDLKIKNFHQKDFKELLINNTIKFINKDLKILYSIINRFFNSNKSRLLSKEKFLFKLITQSKEESKAIKHIINKFGITNKTYPFISLFPNKNNVDYLVEKFKNTTLYVSDTNVLIFLRDWLFSENKEIGYYYEKQITEAGFFFSELLPTLEELDLKEKIKQDSRQNDFDTYFDINKLTNEITSLFHENHILEITWEKLSALDEKWYSQNNCHFFETSSYRIITKSLINDSINLEELIDYIKNSHVIIFVIKEKIESNYGGFDINEQHIYIIKNYCYKLIETFNFNTLLLNNNINFDVYELLELLYFFDKKYNINFTETFYLNSIKYCDTYANNKISLDYLIEKINNNELIEKQIIKNIEEDNLDYNTFLVHINYVLNNNITECYDSVETFILREEYSAILDQYLEKLSNSDKKRFLKSCCNNTDKYLCWNAIDSLIKYNLDNTFIKNLANKYLESNQDNFKSNALSTLFYCNDDNALETYLRLLKEFSLQDNHSLRDDYSIKYLNHFTNSNNLIILKDIFEIIYDEKLNGDFDYYYGRQNFNQLVSNFSQTHNGFMSIQNIFKDLKLKLSNKNKQYFFVNHYIEISKNSYYSSLSTPLSFQDVKNIINKIENINTTVENQYNFNGGTFNNNQFGNQNVQNNYVNPFTHNEDVDKIENLIKEFNSLQVENEEWKQIFIDGMRDLIELKESETEEKVIESKNKLAKLSSKIYDYGLKTNNWKNIAILPLELQDKLPKLIELSKNIGKLFIN